MTQPKIKYQAFDALALEEKLAQDYMINDSFDDGMWDASVIGSDPNPEAWITSADYRKGYLSGIEQHFDNKYAQLR